MTETAMVQSLIGDLTVQVGRLKKRITKLQKQRDHHKEQNVHLERMLTLYPHIRREFKRIDEAKQEQINLKNLQQRAKEQELLIKILLKDTDLRGWEIKQAYDSIIKSEITKLNEITINS
jgi:hypothetical protein